MDGEIGHMREKTVMPDPDEIELTPRKFAEPGDLIFGGDVVPPMVQFGKETFVHVTGSTHKETGMRDVQTQKVHETLITRLYDKVEKKREEICNPLVKYVVEQVYNLK